VFDELIELARPVKPGEETAGQRGDSRAETSLAPALPGKDESAATSPSVRQKEKVQRDPKTGKGWHCLSFLE